MSKPSITRYTGKIANQLVRKYQKENERLYKSLEEQRHFYLKELEKKENIIKEVREINNEIIECGWDYNKINSLAIRQLEILDEENEND